MDDTAEPTPESPVDEPRTEAEPVLPAADTADDIPESRDDDVGETGEAPTESPDTEPPPPEV